MELKQKLKEKLSDLGNLMLTFFKKASCFLLECGLAAILIAVFAFGVLKLPEAHSKWLRAKVGSKVYMIKDKKDGGGGTGFAVTSPSGANYILTNDHVCGVSSDKLTVLVIGQDEVEMRRRIIAHDEYSDLCLVEGLPGIKGLEIADKKPSKGDTLNAIGHPRLMPLHNSSGEMTGQQTIAFVKGPISMTNPFTGEENPYPPEYGGILEQDCMLPKNKIVNREYNMMFAIISVKMCLVEIKDAYTTSVIVHPGNSGSPVVDFFGKVNGAVFATDETNWGRMVSLFDIKQFLKNY